MAILFGFPTPQDGKSAYQTWLDLGFVGTEADFIASLKGATGTAGINGTNGAAGKSAYQTWIDLGNSGTETDFINWLKADISNLGLPVAYNFYQGSSGITTNQATGSYVKIGKLVVFSGSYRASLPNGSFKLPLPISKGFVYLSSNMKSGLSKYHDLVMDIADNQTVYFKGTTSGADYHFTITYICQ